MEKVKGVEIRPGIRKRLLRAYILVTFVLIVLFLVFLPYRFYQRDVETARQKSKELSVIIKESLISTMISNQKPEPLRELIKTFQNKSTFKFRLIRSLYVAKQHGVKEDDQAVDEVIRKVLNTGKGVDDWISDTQFRHVSPYISDERCQKCHVRLDGNKIEPGSVLGVSEIIFELQEQKSKSIRFIIEITLMGVICMVILGAYLFLVVKWNLLDPLSLD